MDLADHFYRTPDSRRSWATPYLWTDLRVVISDRSFGVY